jgi:hypothetical protein
MDGAQHKGFDSSGSAELKELARVRQSDDRVLHFFELTMKPGLELGHGHVWNEAIVEGREWEAKLCTKLLNAEFSQTSLDENKVRGPPNRRQIIDEGAGPVEDDVTNHRDCLTQSEQRGQRQVILKLEKRDWWERMAG